MASPHNADSSEFHDTIEMLTGADVMSATQLRAILEDLHDNTAYLEAQTSAVRTTALLKLRTVESDVAITDTQNLLGVVDGITAGHPVILAKADADGVGQIGDWDLRRAIGTVASITGPVRGAARAPILASVLLIGTGGNRCCISTDEGQSWIAGADIGATPQCVVWNAPKTRFMVTFVAGVNVTQDADGATSWASVSSGLTSAQGGIAVISNGDTFVCGLNATPQIKVSKSDNGGSSWAVQSGSPDAGLIREASGGPGWLCGDGGDLMYHVYSASGGQALRVSSSPDGVTWTLLATLAPPGLVGTTQLFATQPTIYMCQTTGMLLVTCVATDFYETSTLAYVSADLGVSWSRAAVFRGSGATSGAAWGVAAGRVFCTFGSRLFVSDGIR